MRGLGILGGMNYKVLLIDNGVTVQKIVALSLDKSQYSGLFAGSKDDAKKMILDQKPDLILVSDRATGIEWQRFPKEVETWLGIKSVAPPMILLASGEIKEAKHYKGVLQKPFTPQALLEMISQALASPMSSASVEEDRIQNLMEETGEQEAAVAVNAFLLNEESESEGIMNENLKDTRNVRSSARDRLESLWEVTENPQSPVITPSRTESVSDLWGPVTPAADYSSQNANPSEAEPEILRTSDSLAYKSLLENQVQQQLESQNVHEMVEKVLARLLPPLVERLVQERLDQLLAEQERDKDSSYPMKI